MNIFGIKQAYTLHFVNMTIKIAIELQTEK